jgi:Domain of unknown function (DUF222)
MRALADLPVSDLLDEVEELALARRRADARLLEAAAEFALAHGERWLEDQRRSQPNRPGAQQAVRLGGAGTPRVAEFAPALLAARMRLSAWAGARLVADALDLAHRLPRTWARVRAIEVDAQHARFVARRCRDLSVEEAEVVDRRIAEIADGRVSWARFETLVDAAVMTADPATAAAREHEAARRQYARPTRSTSETRLPPTNAG